jgi:hypothetical protein
LPEKQRDMALLLKTLEDLEDFLPYLVLVGGWVPFLYSRILWKVHQDPILTVDIDFGLAPRGFTGKETIGQRVIRKGWGEHHVRLGHDHPFVPVVQADRGRKADVEFIADPGLSLALQQKLVGKDVLVSRVEHMKVLLDRTIVLPIRRFSLKVPAPATFVFHKLLSFPQRPDPDKRGKDLYYAYFTILYSPDRESLMKEVRSLIHETTMGPRVKANLVRYFEDVHTEGPVLLAQSAAASSLPMIVSDVAKDAFERIGKLLD